MDNSLSRYHDLIPPLLSALNWNGEERDIFEALPQGSKHAGEKHLTLQSFRDTLANLGYESRLETDNRKLTLPVIIFDRGDEPHLLRTQLEVSLMRRSAKVFLTFQPMSENIISTDAGTSLWYELRRFHPQLRGIILVSLLIGIAALAPILYNRSLYDTVIGSGSFAGLPALFLGVALALTAEMALRIYRNYKISAFGGRIDHVVSCSVFERLLFIPPVYTERTSISAQIARLRDFENVREFFTGPLATLFFELPLIAVYLVIMGVLTGWLALIPVGLLACYALLLQTMQGKLKLASRSAAAGISQNQDFLLETTTKLRALRLAGMEKVWKDRYKTISANASLASFKSASIAQNLETYSYVLMTLGGIATLGFGVVAVIGNTLTSGALIAAMMLVWRIIAPLQICCASIMRLNQLQSSTQQVRRLLSFAPEHTPYTPVINKPTIEGRISFNRVSLRYNAESEPALLGVSFDIKPGQIVAIKGANGSGKSTILKVILGLYRPSNGTVRIDNIDIRQFDPVLLRQSISYVPQNADFFPGSIRDNLLFAQPAASESDCLTALEEARADREVAALPAGLDTIIEGENADSISFLLKQRLNLTRAYIRKSPIMLFDEASYSLGQENDLAFIKKIDSLRGRSTVLLVTHREDHMALADHLLVMDKGELTHAGPANQVLTIIRGQKS